jgi:homoserine acetyltransferase
VLNAINNYDLGRDVQDYELGVQRIKCPVLLINISTDSEFPPHWAEELAEILITRQSGRIPCYTQWVKEANPKKTNHIMLGLVLVVLKV